MRNRKCRSCGAEILFVQKPDKTGWHVVEVKELLVVTKQGDVVRGHESHFAHCPDVQKFRKGGKIDGKKTG